MNLLLCYSELLALPAQVAVESAVVAVLSAVACVQLPVQQLPLRSLLPLQNYSQHHYCFQVSLKKINKSLEPVCCKKQQKTVPDQLKSHYIS